MDETPRQQEELKHRGEVPSLKKVVNVKDRQLEKYKTENAAMNQKIDALQLEIQRIRENLLKTLTDEERLCDQEQTSKTKEEEEVSLKLMDGYDETINRICNKTQIHD